MGSYKLNKLLLNLRQLKSGGQTKNSYGTLFRFTLYVVVVVVVVVIVVVVVVVVVIGQTIRSFSSKMLAILASLITPLTHPNFNVWRPIARSAEVGWAVTVNLELLPV